MRVLTTEDLLKKFLRAFEAPTPCPSLLPGMNHLYPGARPGFSAYRGVCVTMTAVAKIFMRSGRGKLCPGSNEAHPTQPLRDKHEEGRVGVIGSSRESGDGHNRHHSQKPILEEVVAVTLYTESARALGGITAVRCVG